MGCIGEGHCAGQGSRPRDGRSQRLPIEGQITFILRRWLSQSHGVHRRHLIEVVLASRGGPRAGAIGGWGCRLPDVFQDTLD